MFFFSKSIAASYSTHFPLWVQQLEVLFCFICAVANFNAVAGTTRRHGLHDNRKAFGLREMAHVFPGLTSNGETMPSPNLQWLSGFLMPRNNPTKNTWKQWMFNTKKKSCVFVPSLFGIEWPQTERTDRKPATFTASCWSCLSRRFCTSAVPFPRKPRNSDKASATCKNDWKKWGEIWVSHFLTRCFVKITQLWPGLDASVTTANHSKRVCLCCMAQGLCSQRQVGFLVDLGKAGSIFIRLPSTYDSSTKTKLQKPSWWSHVESY